MDSNDQERERGITIFAKSATVDWGDYEINIVDTPGHADFSGEVERTLAWSAGVCLLVDANEGPMPQTRYVLRRALALGLRPIVVLNKADRPNAEPDKVLNHVFDLFVELGATDEQADFPHLYASALEGWAARELDDPRDRPATRCSRRRRRTCPLPRERSRSPFQMQVATLDWNEYVGRLFGGRVLRGEITPGPDLCIRVPMGRRSQRFTLTKIWGTPGESQVEKANRLGRRHPLSGRASTRSRSATRICHPDKIEALPPLEIDEPTVSMTIMPNNSPFAGRTARRSPSSKSRNACAPNSRPTSPSGSTISARRASRSPAAANCTSRC